MNPDWPTILVADAEDNEPRTISLRPIVNVYGKQARQLKRLRQAQGVVNEHAQVVSSKADGKREAWKYAEHRVGHPLTWKRARQLINQWARDERHRGTA